MSAEPQSESYPGNLSLPAEVRDKILSAFRHSLDLFRDGKLDDCLIGCDFILKMDPRFAPARKLQEKAKNPKADVNIEELRRIAAAAGPPSAAGATPQAAAPASPAGPRITLDTGIGEPPPPPSTGGMDDLSLDSLSLDGPLPDFSSASTGEGGLPLETPGGEPDAASDLFTTGAIPAELTAPQGPAPEEEIASLLEQGDQAITAGGPQQAIEIWSRIFLIDINNAEAVARIESARQRMAAESRRMEVEVAAEEDASARAAASVPPPASAPPPPPRTQKPSPHDLSAIAPSTDVLAEELDQSGPPGRRSWSVPRGKETVAAEPPRSLGSRLGVIRINRRVAMIGGAALLVIVAGLYLLLRPSAEAPPAPAAAGPSLAHATALFQEGKIAETTAELKRIPPSDPDYARAQKLLASLTASADTTAAGEPGPAGAAGEPAAAAAGGSGDPAALRAEAVKALSEKRYIDAMKSFSLAAPHFQSDPTFAQEMGAASDKVSELTPAVKLYNDGEYETAIPILWRIYQGARDNQDAKSYLLRSYFNQGIGQLQNGLYEKANESFGEVLALDPNDGDAARHRQFAERYRSGELDLLGRIYVRYVSPRS